MADTRLKEVRINTPNIGLDQFLKWANVVASGGEGKQMIQQGLVLVNGEREVRRSKILVPGDVVEVKGRGQFRVKLAR